MKFIEYYKQKKLRPAATAIAWVASHPAVTAPIIGTRNVDQLKESLAALELEMTTEMRAEISALSKEPPLATDRRDEQMGLKIH